MLLSNCSLFTHHWCPFVPGEQHAGSTDISGTVDCGPQSTTRVLFLRLAYRVGALRDP